MEPSEAEERVFAFGNTEWSNYTKYRPKYPPSLIKLIQDHHKKYSNRYTLAHDVASGSGVFVPVLAEQFGFNHIHVSDPGPGNIQRAQEALSSWVTARQEHDRCAQRTTITFSRTTGEEMHMCAVVRSVDLVSIMEAAHWMDGPKMMASAAETLTSGGTLALVIYGAAAHIKDNARANAAFKKAVGAIWGHTLETKRQAEEAGVAELERGLMQACAGLDWVPVDDEVWKNLRRIRIRGKDKGEYPNEIPYTSEHHFAPSCVKASECYERYEEEDEAGKGWEVEVDKEWFKGYITSMEDPEHVASMQEFKQLMEILEDEYAKSRIVVEWTVDIILATRR